MTPGDDFDLSSYQVSMKKMALLTPLFSDGETAYIPYRFAERLYAKCSNGENIAQSNAVFDTILSSGAGVGVKTFVMSTSVSSKFEKVQEFTKQAGGTRLNSLPKQKIMEIVSDYRNSSIKSDCAEFGISLQISKYHCFIRKPGYGVVIEEPYELIDTNNLSPSTREGERRAQFDESAREFFFTDKRNVYSYSKSKSVLMKKFKITDSNVLARFPLEMDEEIWSLYYQGLGTSPSRTSIAPIEDEVLDEEGDSVDLQIPGVDYVVLPLYGTRYKTKMVQPKSGINQWVAGGRDRKFGEAYIAIPKKIRSACPDFFPKRYIKFDLSVPDKSSPISVQICQDDGKALMSDPNIDLCGWLYKVIDPNFSEADLGKAPNRKPYTYKDLLRVGKDCVVVSKGTSANEYKIAFGPIGGYENFLQELNDSSN